MPTSRTLPIFGLAILVAFPSPGLWATACGGEGDQSSYETTWTFPERSKAKAEKARYGLLYYFVPTKGDTVEHSLFATKAMSEQSRRSPMVRVKGDEKGAPLRKKYGVDGRLHTIVITDWYGNPMTPKPFVTPNSKAKFPLKKIVATIQRAESFVDQTRAKLRKKLGKGEKAFEKQNWRGALKEYLVIVELEGFKECAKARDRIEEIVETGLGELESAKKLEPDAKKKTLRALAREYKGTKVEVEAEKALTELKGTASDSQSGPFWPAPLTA